MTIGLFHPEKLILSHNRPKIIIYNPLINEFFRCALAQRLVWRHHPEAVRVAKEQVKVVAAEKNGLVLLAREFMQDVHQLDFARIVQEGGGFVHEDDGRVLHQSLGNHYFLLLTIAQRDEVSVDQMADADGFEAVVDDLFVFGFQFG